MAFRYFLMLFLILPSLAFSQSTTMEDTHFTTLHRFITASLQGQGLEDFESVSNTVENNIFWKKAGAQNKYRLAYQRSEDFLNSLRRDDVPSFVFLIPALESGWNPTEGNPASDYGYWQMVTDVVTEIRSLDEASDELRSAEPDSIRSDPQLSTEAALIHLRRYYFYFRHVANFSETDAWLFAVTAFNWGSGNVKTLLAEMQTDGSTAALSFADFYQYLYSKSIQSPDDKSMRVALEYLPNLWNIARLVHPNHSEALKTSLTLSKSSSVSMP